MQKVLATDEDFQRFILDGLGQETFQRLEGIQDRMERETKLLALYADDLIRILSALDRLYSAQTDRFRHLLHSTAVSSTETARPSMPPVSPASISERSRAPIPPPGGAYDPAWHIPGAEEEIARDHLIGGGGMPVVLIGPEWFGKTWALHHILHNLAPPG